MNGQHVQDAGRDRAEGGPELWGRARRRSRGTEPSDHHWKERGNEAQPDGTVTQRRRGTHLPTPQSYGCHWFTPLRRRAPVETKPTPTRGVTGDRDAPPGSGR